MTARRATAPPRAAGRPGGRSPDSGSASLWLVSLLMLLLVASAGVCLVAIAVGVRHVAASAADLAALAGAEALAALQPGREPAAAAVARACSAAREAAAHNGAELIGCRVEGGVVDVAVVTDAGHSATGGQGGAVPNAAFRASAWARAGPVP